MKYERVGFLAVAEQAGKLRQHLKLQQKDSDSEENASEDEKTWGANKRAYYDADTAEYEAST